MGAETAKLPMFSIPKFSAKLEIEYDEFLQMEDVIAFCAIARPQKFYASLTERNLKIVKEFSFPDHHLYTDDDLKKILNSATDLQAVAVTTEKDYVKIPKQLRVMLHLVKARAEFAEADKFMDLLKTKIK
jgi:tetraacyldisaccharide 4'-kinase